MTSDALADSVLGRGVQGRWGRATSHRPVGPSSGSRRAGGGGAGFGPASFRALPTSLALEAVAQAPAAAEVAFARDGALVRVVRVRQGRRGRVGESILPASKGLLLQPLGQGFAQHTPRPRPRPLRHPRAYLPGPLVSPVMGSTL